MYTKLIGEINTQTNNNLPNPIPDLQYQYMLNLLEYFENNNSPMFINSTAQHTFIHHKEILLIMKNLVIRLFLAIILVACSSVKQEKNKDLKEIFKLEVGSHKAFINDDKITYSQISNDYLKESLNTKSVVYGYLSDDEVKSLLNELKKANKTINLDLPQNFHVKRNDELGIDGMVDIKLLNISYPLILKKNGIAIIAYSFGYKNSLEGGIKIYRIIDGKWKYDKSFNLWIS